MSRPVSIQDSAVLNAARKIFLQHGYKATAAQVARAAGVSEGSLFKRYKTKTDLFMAAMRVEGIEMPWHKRLKESVGSGDIHALLEGAGHEMLQRLRIIMPCMIVMRSSGMPWAKRFGTRGVAPPVYHARILARFFRAEMKRGRLAMRSPESHAHAFIGSLSHYVFCETS
jgi:AcrR family transcriptional regulator